MAERTVLSQRVQSPLMVTFWASFSLLGHQLGHRPLHSCGPRRVVKASPLALLNETP